MIRTRPDVPEEVWGLIARACEGSLTDPETRELESQLTGHPQRQRALLDYCGVHADLFLMVGIGQTVEKVRTLITPAEQDDDPVVDAQLVPKRLAPAVLGGPLHGRRLLSASNWIASSTWFAMCLVAIAFYSGFTLLAWNLRPSVSQRANLVVYDERGKRSTPSKDVGNVVATLTSASEVRWRESTEQSLTAGSSIAAGDLVDFLSGQVQLTFVDGATVTLDGPTRFACEAPNHGRLDIGQVLASVPKRAIGFMVDTQLARVVDLGTEFAIDADEQGRTEIQVFKGKVELLADPKRGDGDLASQPITLIAGEARRVERDRHNDGVITRKIASKPNRLAQQITQVSLQQISVEGAHASSTHPALNVDDLIRGRGLKAARHSSAWQGAMWHSMYGDVKNVIVSFDLARPHRLDSMKVWNFNDNRYQWAGVKQADIYVSASGKGDPLFQPGEWMLVVEDQQLAPGTGNDNYDLPTVVSLNRVEGRFVAIVIDNALGSDPRPANGGREPNIVGLSEVQFFGTNLASPKSQPMQPMK